MTSSSNQEFKFDFSSGDEVEDVLRNLGNFARLQVSKSEFFEFRNLSYQAPFSFNCEVTRHGLITEQSGAYSEFEGRLVIALAERFGSVTVTEL